MDRSTSTWCGFHSKRNLTGKKKKGSSSSNNILKDKNSKIRLAIWKWWVWSYDRDQYGGWKNGYGSEIILLSTRSHKSKSGYSAFTVNIRLSTGQT